MASRSAGDAQRNHLSRVCRVLNLRRASEVSTDGRPQKVHCLPVHLLVRNGDTVVISAPVWRKSGRGVSRTAVRATCTPGRATGDTLGEWAEFGGSKRGPRSAVPAGLLRRTAASKPNQLAGAELTLPAGLTRFG